jgi:monovalent cation:H+ antiporter-2, CPA2 family
MTDSINLKIVLILAIGFGYASVFGYLFQRAKISPILGYLFAGYLIGPYSYGYVADLHLSEQLAEIGVILMMFGVGLHFKWQDLLNTRHIAIPGAFGQTLIATLAGTILLYSIGWPIEDGIIVGLAMGVASTVVLVRVLSDNNLIQTPQGHVAIGWLIVEDMITVIALLLIPSLAVMKAEGTLPILSAGTAFGAAIFKFALLTIFMFTVGRKVTTYVLSKVLATNSHELFTLTVLAITFVIAAGSALLIGTSIVLGAFISGMVMGQTRMRHQIESNAMPLKDAFVVVFFLSIGMLFNPSAVIEHFFLFLSFLGIIFIVKPLSAFLITKLLNYPLNTALTVSLGLAQIGEFSFILGEEAMRFKLLSDEGYDLIIACSLVSIALNPLLFKLFKNKLKEKNEIPL